MVGKRPHGLQQELRDGAQQPHRHSRSQVLLGEVEHAGARRQLHVQSSGVVLHAQHHQLEEQELGEAEGEGRKGGEGGGEGLP